MAYTFSILFAYTFAVENCKIRWSPVLYIQLLVGDLLCCFTEVSRTHSYFKSTWLCQLINVLINQLGPRTYLLMFIFQNSRKGPLPRLLLSIWKSWFSQIILSFKEYICSSIALNLTWVCKSCTRSLASASSCSATLLLLSVCSRDALSSSISACIRLALRSTIANCSLRSSWLLRASSKWSCVSCTERENDSYSCSK